MNRNYTSDRQNGRARHSGKYPVPHRSSLPAARSSEDDTPPLLKIFKACFVGLIAFVAVSVISTCIAAAIAYANPDPNSMVSLVSLVSILPPAFVGGLLTSRKSGKNPLLCGILFGLVMTVTSLLLSLIFRSAASADSSFTSSVLLRLPSIGASVLGAIAGNKRKSSRKRFG